MTEREAMFLAAGFVIGVMSGLTAYVAADMVRLRPSCPPAVPFTIFGSVDDGQCFTVPEQTKVCMAVSVGGGGPR
jgi:hypothetical protein